MAFARPPSLRQPNDAGMSQPIAVDKGTEVLVHREQDALVGHRSFEHRRITGIGSCVRDPGDV